MSTPWYAVAAVCISALALVIAIGNYRRKAGILVRGAFTIASSRECNDHYVANILLENLKDRAITVFAVYLRVGHSYYVEIEDFREKPLLLKAYESYQREFGPIQLYGVNTHRIDLNGLLKDSKVAKRLVLSTLDGKYVVPSSVRRWSPVGDFFRNHMTAVVHPVRTIYKDKYVGGNIKYVIEFIGEGGNTEVVAIHPDDYRLKKFRTFSFTHEALESVASMNVYLDQQVKLGTLSVGSFKVHDADEWRQRATEFYSGNTVEATYYSLFQYHVIGRFITRSSDRALAKENERRRSMQASSESDIL
jgi:hypothetical protein